LNYGILINLLKALIVLSLAKNSLRTFGHAWSREHLLSGTDAARGIARWKEKAEIIVVRKWDNA